MVAIIRQSAADRPAVEPDTSADLPVVEIPRRKVMGLDIAMFDYASALDHLAKCARGEIEGQTKVSFINANNVNISRGNSQYRAVLDRHLLVADGLGMTIATKVLTGSPLPANLNGTDLVPALLTYLSEPMTIGLIGATPASLQGAVAALRAMTPWHRILPLSDGYFNRGACDDLLEAIGRARPDILIVAMGTPVQEIWVEEALKPAHARLVLTVGALFDFLSGTVSRAPEGMRRYGMEWLYRLWLEPKRLWRRYVLGNPVFMWSLLLEKLSQRNI